MTDNNCLSHNFLPFMFLNFQLNNFELVTAQPQLVSYFPITPYMVIPTWLINLQCAVAGEDK